MNSAQPPATDVAIVGGGLAGLTLALQLRQRCPDVSIRVLERRSGAAPAATHKVGESTVEIGAHYLANVLGLRDHLDAAQTRKFGFRYFFSEGCGELDQACELGISRVFPTPSWQVERGTLENHLGQLLRDRNIQLTDGCTVRTLNPGHDGAPHVIVAERGGHAESIQARWLIDASGRAGLLRRQLGLDEDNGHRIGAAWFRIDARFEIDAWCTDPAWRARCEPQERWRSTNHLCGPGYWVWVIALASGARSIGIVADAAAHPVAGFNSFERALAWLQPRQPALARRLAAHRDDVLDFHFMRNVSYGCRQVFSADRWALTGEAGLFLDPFYSPGTDFIAIANTYITELIARDRAGAALKPLARQYQQLFFSFYRNMLALYRGQYALFGDGHVMTAKVLWDYAYYWGVLAPLVIGGWQTDTALFTALEAELIDVEATNLRMQALFRAWHAHGHTAPLPLWLDQQDLTWFRQLNARLHDRLDAAQIRARMHSACTLLHDLAAVIGATARRDSPGLDIGPLPTGTRGRQPPILFAATAASISAVPQPRRASA